MTDPGDAAAEESTAPEVVDPVETARQTRTARARWLDPAWHAEVHEWIEQRLAERGLAIVGSITQPHIRPWSTALAVPTTAGQVWFKASGPGTAHEAALLDAMVRWGIPGVLEPFALEPACGWILLPG